MAKEISEHLASRKNFVTEENYCFFVFFSFNPSSRAPDKRGY